MTVRARVRVLPPDTLTTAAGRLAGLSVAYAYRQPDLLCAARMLARAAEGRDARAQRRLTKRAAHNLATMAGMLPWDGFEGALCARAAVLVGSLLD